MYQQTSQKKRIDWIDYSKGILITLVISGHAIPEFGLHLDFLEKIIYSFHMPAFFILSGYLFKFDACLEKKKFINKKAKQLLLPYLMFCVLILICHAAKQLILHNDIAFFTRLIEKNTIVNTLLLTNSSAFSNLWFLPSIFTAECALYIIFSLVHSEKLRSVICCGLGLFAFLYGRFVAFPLPLCLDSACLAIFYLYLGYLLRIQRIERFFDKNVIFVSGAALFLVINFIDYYYLNNIYCSFYNLHFSNEAVFLITSILGTLLVVGICKRLKFGRLMSGLGKNSLYIYGFHFIAQNIVGFIPNPTINSLIGNILLLIVIVTLNLVISLIMIRVYTWLKSHLLHFEFRRRA